MNSYKGKNAFSDIPGFDASKGERIVKALQRLWEKIECLEQIRTSEKKSRSEEMQANCKDEDLTLTDVQYKLLVLQLQYARSILRKQFDSSSFSLSKIMKNDQSSHLLDKHYSKKNEYEKDFENIATFQEIPVKKNLTEDLNSCVNPDILKNVAKIDAQVSTDDKLFKSEDSPDQLALSAYRTSSKPHYHLKLDDVPFILGASSTASHSVVANVQNIIAMMKSHNKALCGPKHHVSKSAVNECAPGDDTQDATKMLNDLSQDLYELALKQQKLVKSIDAAQGMNQPSRNVSKNLQRSSKVDRVYDMKHSARTSGRRLRSNSESEIKLHAEVKNVSKRKENDSVQQKPNLLNVRNQSSNISIMDRRKLLRSLQNFKAHLSEEDISWD